MKTLKVLSCTGQCTKLLRQRVGQFITLLVAVIFFALSAMGQLTTSDIVGTATDSSGAVIPNAAVTLLNLGTHDQRNATTNSGGDFSFTLLQPGHYTVTVKAPVRCR